MDDHATTKSQQPEIGERIAKTLDSAFKLLSAIPVSGDGVEIMAEARARLRNAYKLAKEIAEDG